MPHFVLSFIHRKCSDQLHTWFDVDIMAAAIAITYVLRTLPVQSNRGRCVIEHVIAHVILGKLIVDGWGEGLQITMSSIIKTSSGSSFFFHFYPHHRLTRVILGYVTLPLFCSYRWMDEWMDGWMDGWINEHH